MRRTIFLVASIATVALLAAAVSLRPAAIGDTAVVDPVLVGAGDIATCGGSTKVIGTVTYDAAAKRATLDPANDLISGATYKATVTTGTKDLAGNALDQNSTTAGNQLKSWKFAMG